MLGSWGYLTGLAAAGVVAVTTPLITPPIDLGNGSWSSGTENVLSNRRLEPGFGALPKVDILPADVAVSQVIVEREVGALFAGYAPAGARVTLIANDDVMGQAVASRDGTWEIEVSHLFEAGDHDVIAVATLPSGDRFKDYPTASDIRSSAIVMSVPANFSGIAVMAYDGRMYDSNDDGVGSFQTTADVIEFQVAQSTQTTTDATSQTERTTDGAEQKVSPFAPVREWLEKSAQDYQGIVIKELSVPGTGDGRPAPTDEAGQTADAEPTDSQSGEAVVAVPGADGAAGDPTVYRAERPFPYWVFDNVTEWIAAANRDYQQKVVRELETGPATDTAAKDPTSEDVDVLSPDIEPAPEVAAPAPQIDVPAAPSKADVAGATPAQSNSELTDEVVRMAREAEEAAQEAMKAAKAQQQAEADAEAREKARVAAEAEAEQKRLAEAERKRQAEAERVAAEQKAQQEAQAKRAVAEAAAASEAAKAARAAEEAARLAEARKAEERDALRKAEQELAAARQQERDAAERLAKDRAAAEAARAAEKARIAAAAQAAEKDRAAEAERVIAAGREKERRRVAAEEDDKTTTSVQTERSYETAAVNDEAVRRKSRSYKRKAKSKRKTRAKRRRLAAKRKVRRIRAARRKASRRRAAVAGYVKRRPKARHRPRVRGRSGRCRYRAGRRVKPLPGRYVVKKGDTLWKISKRHYRKGYKYRKIVRANRRKIRNPNRIYPCQSFYLPRR